jgi:hypothetical protein
MSSVRFENKCRKSRRGRRNPEKFLVEVVLSDEEKRIANSGIELVETGDETPGAGEIGVVFGAEMSAEEAFFGVHARDQRY